MKKIREFFSNIRFKLSEMESRKRAMVITAFLIPSVILYVILGCMFNDIFAVTLLGLFTWFVIWVVYRVVLELTETEQEANKRTRGY